MCGIAGYIGRQDRGEGLLEQMCDLMIHRGPDDAGYYRDDDIALGMRRLSIIDVAGGHQPIFNEDRTLVAVMNGEIYNYLELKRDYLRSHTFATNSDTEVLLHLFEEMGIACVQKLNGMYAFALWDLRNKTLYVVRDRIGIKPLYYYARDGELIFASEIKPILAHAIDEEIDPSALHDYLTLMYVPAPRTMFRHIRKLDPGSYLQYHAGQWEVKKYWRLTPAIRTRASEGEIIEELDSLFNDSIGLQLRSDVPIGTFLSGGIDSSAVVAYESRVSHHVVNTFSVGFERGLVNELPYARQVAGLFGTNHHELVIDGDDLLQNLPRLVEQMEEPHGDSALLPTYMLSKYASDYVTVILNGTGGDELFGGYDKYLTQTDRTGLFRALKIVPDGLLELLPERSPLGRRTRRLVRSAKSHFEFYYYRSAKFDTFQQKALLEGYDEEQDTTRDALRGYFELPGFDWDREHKNAYMLADIHTYLQDDLLLLLDKMAMAHSMEGRVPFLDHRIVEFSQTIPARMKINGLEKKHLMKRWLSSRLPAGILNRNKAGFGAPLSNWYDHHLLEHARDVLLDGGALTRSLFRADHLERVLAPHAPGALNAQQVFMLLSLEYWYRIFVKERAGRGLVNA